MKAFCVSKIDYARNFNLGEYLMTQSYRTPVQTDSSVIFRLTGTNLSGISEIKVVL